jgi:hypothetical protein
MSVSMSISSTLEHIADRIKDPFLGAYSFFVLITNWRIILALFYWEDYSVKVETINNLIKANYFASAWKPLVITIIFFVISSIFKTLVRLFLQAWQRLDDKVAIYPMDPEKISFMQANTELLKENQKLTLSITQYSKVYSYIMYFLSQNDQHVVRVNNLTNQDRAGANVVDNMFHSAHQLATGFGTLKSNIEQNVALELK